jgi:hypothetical protein
MNWEAVGAVAEMMGALGVVASLAYLAVQIRQNTRQMADHTRSLRLAALESTANSFSRFRDPLIRDAGMAALWVRGLQSYTTLTPEERIRMGSLLQELFFTFQNTFARLYEGALHEGAWLSQVQTIELMFRSAGVREWWTEARRLFDPAFTTAVEERSGR